MALIGLFYGTDTGNTETVAKQIKEVLENKLSNTTVDLFEIYKKTKSDMGKYDFLVLGMPTWYDGELQGDWEAFIPEMQQIDFSNKKVAFFGLGDQCDYAEYFCDALGVFAEIVEKNGGKIYGFTSVEGYQHEYSKAQRNDLFVGLCLDKENQDDLTEIRVQNWANQIIKEFGL